MPPIMENRMDKKIENKIEAGGIMEFQELNFSYYIGETILCII